MSASKPQSIKCDKCKSAVPRREFLICSQCNLKLDLGCANVPFVRFNIMDAERKKKWKCDKCLIKNKAPVSGAYKQIESTSNISSNISSSSHNTDMSLNIAHENVTTRHRINRRASSVELLDDTVAESEMHSALLENTRLSLPDLNTVSNQELQDEINVLKTKLASAHIEIDRLNMQVTDLTKKLGEQQRKGQVMRHLLTDPSPRKLTSQSKTNGIKGDALPQQPLIKDNISQQRSEETEETKAPTNTETVDNSSLRCDSLTNQDSLSNTLPKIYIFGSQQCVGLGSRLLQSRFESKYGQYSVSAVTKPNASADEILKECNYVEDSSNNYLVLCAGEHDNNPVRVIIELASRLKQFNSINIIVLGVVNNNSLNIDKLNRCLSNICRNVPNCEFINVTDINLQHSRKNYLYFACRQINYIINCHYYSNMYLSCKGLRNILKQMKSKTCSVKSNSRPVKRGTIPYYFPLLKNSHDVPYNVIVTSTPAQQKTNFLSMAHRSPTTMA